MTNPISELDNIVKDLNAAREILESISVNVTFLRNTMNMKNKSREIYNTQNEMIKQIILDGHESKKDKITRVTIEDSLGVTLKTYRGDTLIKSVFSETSLDSGKSA